MTLAAVVLRFVETLLGYYLTSRTRALRAGLALLVLLGAALAVVGGLSVVEPGTHHYNRQTLEHTS